MPDAAATQGPISTATPQVEDVSSRISVPQDSLNGALAPRKYFVLTAAGKPVYASGLVSKDDEELLTTTVGVIQAIISIFADEDDKLRYIDAGQVRIAFLLRSPLYFAAVSEWGEPESIVFYLPLEQLYPHAHLLYSCEHTSNICTCIFFPSCPRLNYNGSSASDTTLTCDVYSKVPVQC